MSDHETSTTQCDVCSGDLSRLTKVLVPSQWTN